MGLSQFLLNCKIDKQFQNMDQSECRRSDPVSQEELRQAHGKPTFSIRTTLLYHCVGSSLFHIEFTDQSALFKQMSLSIGQTFDVSIACTRKGDGDFRPFHSKCLGYINTPIILRLCQSLYLPEN